MPFHRLNAFDLLERRKGGLGIDEWFIVYTDGASRGNPGPSAIGVSLQWPDGTEIDSISKRVEDGTNNEAEYKAAIAGLERALAHPQVAVELRTDSELLVRQLTGEYRTKKPELRKLQDSVRNAARKFMRVRYTHVRREHPGAARADALANAALDAAGHPKVEWKAKGRP